VLVRHPAVSAAAGADVVLEEHFVAVVVAVVVASCPPPEPDPSAHCPVQGLAGQQMLEGPVLEQQHQVRPLAWVAAVLAVAQ